MLSLCNFHSVDVYTMPHNIPIPYSNVLVKGWDNPTTFKAYTKCSTLWEKNERVLLFLLHWSIKNSKLITMFRWLFLFDLNRFEFNYFLLQELPMDQLALQGGVIVHPLEHSLKEEAPTSESKPWPSEMKPWDTKEQTRLKNNAG